MVSKSLQKKIARRIAVAEQIIQQNKDKQAVELAQQEIMNLTAKYNLTLIDMIEIDDMVQDILKK
jgi:membrane-bound ClpP family serine protease